MKIYSPLEQFEIYRTLLTTLNNTEIFGVIYVTNSSEPSNLSSKLSFGIAIGDAAAKETKPSNIYKKLDININDYNHTKFQKIHEESKQNFDLYDVLNKYHKMYDAPEPSPNDGCSICKSRKKDALDCDCSHYPDIDILNSFRLRYGLPALQQDTHNLCGCYIWCSKDTECKKILAQYGILPPFNAEDFRKAIINNSRFRAYLQNHCNFPCLFPPRFSHLLSSSFSPQPYDKIGSDVNYKELLLFIDEHINNKDFDWLHIYSEALAKDIVNKNVYAKEIAEYAERIYGHLYNDIGALKQAIETDFQDISIEEKNQNIEEESFWKEFALWYFFPNKMATIYELPELLEPFFDAMYIYKCFLSENLQNEKKCPSDLVFGDIGDQVQAPDKKLCPYLNKNKIPVEIKTEPASEISEKQCKYIEYFAPIKDRLSDKGCFRHSYHFGPEFQQFLDEIAKFAHHQNQMKKLDLLEYKAYIGDQLTYFVEKYPMILKCPELTPILLKFYDVLLTTTINICPVTFFLTEILSTTNSRQSPSLPYLINYDTFFFRYLFFFKIYALFYYNFFFFFFKKLFFCYFIFEIFEQYFVTNLFVTNIFLIICIFYIFLFFFLQVFLIQRGGQLFLYYYYLFIKNIIYDLISSKIGHKYYFHFISWLFLTLSFLNLFGLIPNTFVLTSQFSFTFYNSFLYFLALNFTGINIHGISLCSLFFPTGAPIFIAPLLVIIEFISYFARVFSLAIRLFANITAGHILLKILSGFTLSMITLIFAFFLSVGIITILWILEFFIGILQAYVFTILVCIYLSDVLLLH